MAYRSADGGVGPVDFANAVSGRGALELDPVGVVEYLSYRHLLDDRTLIKGLRRTPWLHEPDGRGGWSPCDLPPPGRARPPVDEVARELMRLLNEECREYVEGAHRVGILLSGGMDSRIAAAALRTAWHESDRGFEVIALTWGLPGTRDVIYARRIAEAIGWQWHHLELSAEVLRRNILLAGRTGCEAAPMHLHALADVSACGPLDGVLAGTYGDMVGRAESSGKRLVDLRAMARTPLDPFGIVRGWWVAEAERGVAADLGAKDAAWPARTGLARFENEQHMHYLRRKLHGVMAAMLSPVPLWQMFSHPDVYGLMWSLDPEVRDNRYYAAVSAVLDASMADVPWARTGKSIQDASGAKPADEASREYHAYGTWLREDLGPEIARRVTSERLLGTGIFNEAALRRFLREWRRGRSKTVGLVDETVAWLASLDVMLETYDVGAPPAGPSMFGDAVRGWLGTAKACVYTQARSRLRE